jgi:hypothetical protein
MQVTFNWARQLISRRSPSEVASTHCAERAGAQHWQPVRLTYFGGRSIGSELDSGRTRCEKVKETREGDAVGRRPPTAGSDASWGGVEGGESSHGSPQWEKGRLNAGRNIGSDLERLAFLFRGERTEGASSACPGDCVAVSWTWQRRPGEPWPLSRASRAARTAPNCARVDSCSACVSRAVRTASNCARSSLVCASRAACTTCNGARNASVSRTTLWAENPLGPPRSRRAPRISSKVRRSRFPFPSAAMSSKSSSTRDRSGQAMSAAATARRNCETEWVLGVSCEGSKPRKGGEHGETESGGQMTRTAATRGGGAPRPCRAC